MNHLTPLTPPLPPFILASGSPQRKWILEQLGLKFTIDPPDIDESLHKVPFKKPHAIVKHLALAKAQTIAKNHPHTSILSSDTLVVSSKGEILEKPRNKAEAKQMLESYNGSYCDVYSGLAWIPAKRTQPFVDYEKTRLHFKALPEKVLDDYLADGEWKYCSGGVKIEKIGDWIKKREGDYWNVVGLPVNLLRKIEGKII